MGGLGTQVLFSVHGSVLDMDGCPFNCDIFIHDLLVAFQIVTGYDIIFFSIFILHSAKREPCVHLSFAPAIKMTQIGS